MLSKQRSKWVKWFKIAVIVYIAGALALHFLQEKLIFRPTALSQDYEFKFDQPFQEINLPVNQGKNISIIKFTVPGSARKGIVLYFHGNRENIEKYAPSAINFTRNNYEVWMLDYPGYGKSTGERTEEILYSDALILYNMAKAAISHDSIILYGRSLGTGIAAQLAARRESKRLILEAPYYSLDALASRTAFVYPVSVLLNYHFPTYKYLQNVIQPITIIHGTDDGVIPYRHSKRLIKTAPPGTELIPIEGAGHNDLQLSPLFGQKLDSILQH